MGAAKRRRRNHIGNISRKSNAGSVKKVSDLCDELLRRTLGVHGQGPTKSAR